MHVIPEDSLRLLLRQLSDDRLQLFVYSVSPRRLLDYSLGPQNDGCFITVENVDFELVRLLFSK